MKKLVVLLCSLFILVAGTAFAGGEKEAKAAAPIEIEVYNLDTGDNIKQAFSEIIERYEVDNPNIKVKMSYVGWDEGQDKLLVRAGAGDPPNLAQFNDDYIGDHTYRGLLMPLDELFASFDLSTVFGPAVDISRVKGRLMAFQIAQKPRGFFFVNVDWFKKAGMDLPTEKWGDSSWTWDTMVETAKKLQSSPIDPSTKSWGFAHHLNDEPKRWMLSATNAPDNLIMDNRLMFDAPWCYETMQFFADMINVHKIHPPWATMIDVGKRQLFLDQKLAMTQSGVWELPFFGKAEFEWDLVPIPKKVRAITEASLVNYGILKGAKHPQESANFAMYMLKPENQRSFGKLTGFCPNLKSEAENLKWVGDVMPKRAHILFDALIHTYYGPFNEPGWYYARNVLKPLLADIYNGAKPAKELMLQAQEKGQKELDKIAPMIKDFKF